MTESRLTLASAVEVVDRSKKGSRLAGQHAMREIKASLITVLKLVSPTFALPTPPGPLLHENVLGFIRISKFVLAVAGESPGLPCMVSAAPGSLRSLIRV